MITKLSQKNSFVINNNEIFKKIESINSYVLEEALKQRALNVINHLSSENTIANYITLIEDIKEAAKVQNIKMFTDIIKEIDEKFFNSAYRKENYYVHSLRSRTIVTIFGEITIKRRYYESKHNDSRLFYVDKKLGLKPYDVYDPSIKALVIDYSSTNAASHVSKAIADICSLTFTNNESNKIILSRQTIKNIIDSAPIINVVEKPKEKTPKELHIMLDEKWIHLQGKSRHKTHSSQEVKVAVVYENATNIKHSRMTLNGVHYITSVEGVEDLRRKIMDYLEQSYELEKVEKIFVLGDAATWIQVTPRELKSNLTTTIEYLIDWFHVTQGINRITSFKHYRTHLYQMLFTRNKKGFERTIEALKKDHVKVKEKIEEKSKYILNNWSEIMDRLDNLNKACSMESHISHGIAALFTSVPKAYSVDSLYKRINQRELFLNHHSIRELMLKAYDYIDQDEITFNKSDEKEIFFEPGNFDDLYEEYLSQTTSTMYTFINSHIANNNLQQCIA